MDAQQIKQAFTGAEDAPEEQREALETLDTMLAHTLQALPPLPPAVAALLKGADAKSAPRPEAEWATVAPLPDAACDQSARAMLRFLPSVLRLMLKRRLSDELKALAMEVLKRSVKVAARSLACGWDECGELLEALLNDDARFYAVPSARYYSDEPADVGVAGAYTQPSPYLRVNGDLLAVLEHFGRRGGFHLLLARIRARVLSIARLVPLLKPLAGVRKLVRPEVLRPWMAAVHEAITAQLAGLSEADVRAMDPRKELAELLEQVEALLRTATTDPDAASAAVERLQLDAALRCLRSSVMDRRLWAFTAISASLALSVRLEPDYDAATLRWTTASTSLTSLSTGDRVGLGNAAANTVTRALHGLAPEWLVAWLREQRVADEVFGPRMHPELVQRATDLLRFLAATNELSAALLDSVWHAAAGQQEATVVTIYRLLERSAPAFPAPLLLHLLTAAAVLEPARLELPAVESLVHALTVAAFRAPAADAAVLHGLRLLFRLATPAASDAAHSALRHLSALLALPAAAPHRPLFAQLSVDLLRARSGAAQASMALELLQRLVAAADSPPDAAVALERDFALRQAVLDEARAGAAPLSVEQLKARLSFLAFLATHAPALRPNVAALDALWSTFVAPQPASALAAALLAWLAAQCPEPALPAAQAPLVDLPLLQLCLARLTALPAPDLSPAAFACLLRHVRAVNRAADLLASYDTAARPAPHSLALAGLEAVWSAALLAHNEGVAKSAGEYVVQVHVAAEDLATPAGGASAAAVFLAELMKRLEAATDELTVARCLDMLAAYIAAHQLRARTRVVSVAGGAGSGDKGEMIVVQLGVAGVEGTWAQPMMARDTIGDLRDRLAARLGAAGSALVVCERTLEANLDGEQLEDMGLDARPVLIHLPPALLLADAVAALSRPVLTDAPPPTAPPATTTAASSATPTDMAVASEPAPPPERLVVETPAYFDALFRALRFPSLAPRVWTLVSTALPLNPRLRAALAEPAPESAWSALLPPDEPHRLLYALQIVHALHASPDPLPWALRFVQCGGRAHLLAVLHSWRAAPSTADTLAALLRSVSFLVGHEPLAAAAPLPESDAAALLLRLLALVPAPGGVAGAPLLGALLAPSPRLAALLAQPAPFSAFLRSALLTPTALATAQEVRKLLVGLLALHPAQLTDVLRAALLTMAGEVPPASSTCVPLFELLAELLKNGPGVARPVLDELAARLAALEPLERDDDMSEDALAQGLMAVLRAALAQAGVEAKAALIAKGLLRALLDALFRPATAALHGPLAPPRFKRDTTRVAALELLAELVSAAPMALLQVLLREQITEERAPKSEWEYAPRAEGRAALGYVGLRNMGCTCYMNSLLQQLFMMPRFRRALLAVDYYPAAEKDKRVEDGLLYQLQTTFAFLHESDKQAYHPGRLVAAVGADPGVQMDVDEFFNTLCDRIDEPLKHTPHAALLKSLWRGSLKSQLLGRGEGCTHASERDEEFYALAVDVKGKATLQEALALYVQGEVLQGDNAYKCDSCNRRVATLKRTVLGSLPDVLILALKRFEFDFDTMRKKKLNDACTFPDTLNMYAYTKEGLLEAEGKADEAKALVRPAEYYEYALAGILVHRGVADSGHYYSFIKERGHRTPDGAPVWLEFNDDVVRPFDPKDIPEECYGGVDTALERSVQGRTSTGPLMKTRSAYMLIYERVKPFNAASLPPPAAGVATAPATTAPAPAPTVPAAPAPALAPAPSDAGKGATKREGVEYVESFIIGRQRVAGGGPGSNESFSVAIPRAMYEEVWADNERFNVDRRIWDPAYFAFVADFVRTHAPSAPPRPSPDDAWASDTDSIARPLWELAVRFLLDVLLRSRDRSSVRSFIALLEGLAPRQLPGCKWALRRCAMAKEALDNWTLVELLLLTCRVQEARQLFVSFLMLLLRALRPHEVHLLAPPPPRRRGLGESGGSSGGDSADESDEDEDEERPPIDEERSSLAEITRRLLAFKDYAPLARYWRSFGEYFELFARVAELGWEERRFLIGQGTVSYFIDTFLHDDSPQRKKKSKIRLGDRFEQPNFYHLVGCLDLLICSCPALDALPPTLVDAAHVLRLPREDEELVEHPAFWTKLIRDGGRNRAATVRLLHHYQFNAQRHSELVMKLLSEAVSDADAERMYWLIVDVAGGVLQQEDDFQESRAAWLVEQIVQVLTDRRHTANARRYVLEGVRALRMLARDSPIVTNELTRLAARTAWMDPWLRMVEEYA